MPYARRQLLITISVTSDKSKNRLKELDRQQIIEDQQFTIASLLDQPPRKTQRKKQPCNATLNRHGAQIKTLITGHEGYKNQAFELLEEQKSLANDQKNQAAELLRLAEQIALLRKDDRNFKDALTQGHEDISDQASNLQRDVSKLKEASECREMGMHRIDLLGQEFEALREKFAELSAACREAFAFKELWVGGGKEHQEHERKLTMINYVIESKLAECKIDHVESAGDSLTFD